MADLDHILRTVVGPGLALLPARMGSPRARVMLLAIGLQESRLHHRWQVVDPARPDRKGPARGLWQFERGGGVVGVLGHRMTAELAADACDARGVEPTPAAVHVAFERDDLLACAFARLLLWTDPVPLPAPGEVDSAFRMYLRTWRPGAWGRGSPAQREGLQIKWQRNFAAAEDAIKHDPDFSQVRSRVTSTETPR